jgi:hypothetical protein
MSESLGKRHSVLKEYAIQMGANMLSSLEIECSFIQNKMEPNLDVL